MKLRHRVKDLCRRGNKAIELDEETIEGGDYPEQALDVTTLHKTGRALNALRSGGFRVVSRREQQCGLTILLRLQHHRQLPPS